MFPQNMATHFVPSAESVQRPERWTNRRRRTSGFPPVVGWRGRSNLDWHPCHVSASRIFFAKIPGLCWYDPRRINLMSLDQQGEPQMSTQQTACTRCCGANRSVTCWIAVSCSRSRPLLTWLQYLIMIDYVSYCRCRINTWYISWYHAPTNRRLLKLIFPSSKSSKHFLPGHVLTPDCSCNSLASTGSFQEKHLEKAGVETNWIGCIRVSQSPHGNQWIICLLPPWSSMPLMLDNDNVKTSLKRIFFERHKDH